MNRIAMKTSIKRRGGIPRRKKPKARTHKCDQCSKAFLCADALRKHTVVHSDERPYSCDKCIWTFKRRDLLARHMQRRHPDEGGVGGGGCDPLELVTVKVEVCEGGAEEALEIQPVRRTRRVIKHRCLCCVSTPNEPGDHHHHHSTPNKGISVPLPPPARGQGEGGEGTHKCNVCGRGYSSKSNLKRHLVIHGVVTTVTIKEEVDDDVTPQEEVETVANSSENEGGGAHKCLECGNCFTFRCNLLRHVRNQHGESSLATHELLNPRVIRKKAAGKQLATGKSGELSRTKTKVTKKAPLLNPNQCPECGKIFAIRKNVRRHMVVHRDDRPYSCGLCVWTFKRRDALLDHYQSVHGKAKEVAQSIMKEGATQPFAGVSDDAPLYHPSAPVAKASKRRGRKKRTGPAPLHKCPQCWLVLPTKKSLAAHLSSHNDVRPFGCRLCMWTFARRDTLYMHLKRKHAKSERRARKMAYDAFGKTSYNMRTREKAQASPPSPVKFTVKIKEEPTSPKRVPKPAPVDKRGVIVIVGGIKFSTPDLLVKPPERKVQGCATYKEWFWKDYCRVIEERDCAPLIKDEPELGMSLVEIAELIL